MEYLKQAADDWHSNQLSRIAREHDYLISSIADENNNEPSSNDSSGKVYNLRKVKKSTKDKNHIYY